MIMISFEVMPLMPSSSGKYPEKKYDKKYNKKYNTEPGKSPSTFVPQHTYSPPCIDFKELPEHAF